MYTDLLTKAGHNSKENIITVHLVFPFQRLTPTIICNNNQGIDAWNRELEPVELDVQAASPDPHGLAV